MTEVNIKDEAQKIVRCLASALKLADNSPCLCGTGLLFGVCCKNSTPDKLILLEKEFESALGYKNAEGGYIRSVPTGLFNGFMKKVETKFPCLYPGCNAKPIDCHLIPKNILQASFGNHCLQYKMNDGLNPFGFIKTGVGVAATESVFCSRHDNELFRDIDTLGDLVSPKQQFLLAFKAVAFSLRRTQILLSLDSQVEIFKPILHLKSGAAASGEHYDIDISQLSEQYTRFCTVLSVFNNLIEVLNYENWDALSYFERSIISHGNLFYAGVVNPSHDLEKQRINTWHMPVHFAINVFLRNGKMQVFFACPKDGSEKAYKLLFKQLNGMNDQMFATVINTMLTIQPEGLLLSEGNVFIGEEYKKISALRKRAIECLKTSSEEIFNLMDNAQTIQFIDIVR